MQRFINISSPLNQFEIRNLVSLDAPRPWGVHFQDSASPQMEALVELHDNIMFYLVIILLGVAWILVSLIWNYVNDKSPISNKYLNHGTLIELIWTITPALILILIAFPSFKLLYLMDEVTDPSLTLFLEGHQWDWSYQYPYFLNEDDEELEIHILGSDNNDYWIWEGLDFYMDNGVPTAEFIAEVSNAESENRNNNPNDDGDEEDNHSDSALRDYPLNIPEVSDSAIIPHEIITPYSSDPDKELTLLRNEVRVAYATSTTHDNIHRNSPTSESLGNTEDSEKEFAACQNNLKSYLNQHYKGEFEVEN